MFLEAKGTHCDYSKYMILRENRVDPKNRPASHKPCSPLYLRAISTSNIHQRIRRERIHEKKKNREKIQGGATVRIKLKGICVRRMVGFKVCTRSKQRSKDCRMR